ncbi:ABC transporter substrate-binding protein [Streptomyces radicis]|uniref:ABC transporter substrate-binding protein n=1 Tax=Streptomyces radicis TaxID=1750517 RepID=A0A3A9WQ78_9ACTN|nr:ABC transporter substrate-binding protein [Streptomyces radicis]RKN08347.1 ABC transporter substrate-binding protein [Streptomyces radicis]RKN21617.1 ABC transporter substrate-binding protein [Streptomyces radicis]
MRSSRLPGSRALTALTAATAALAVVLSGCGSGGDDPSGDEGAEGEPVTGGTLSYAFTEAPDCVDPRQRPQLNSRTVGRQLADALTEQDPETGELLPWLATSWEVNDEVTSFTFELRDDVTFSDGEPFNAEAVKANFDAIVELGALAPQAGSFLAGYQQTVVDDESTVTVEFDEPNAQFLQATATQSLVQLSPASLDADPADLCLGEFAGSGPFTLESFTPESSVELTRRDDYAWASPLAENQGAAHVDSVTLEPIPEGSVRQGSLTSGQVDLIESVPASTQEQLAGTEGFTVTSTVLPAIAIPYIPLVHSERLQDADTRRALGLAIDRQAIVDAVFHGVSEPATGVLSTTNPGHVDQSADLRYDPDAAAELLERAGWDTIGDDGIRRNAEGERLSLTITYQSGSTESEQQHQLVQQQWAEVGIELVLDPVATFPDVTMDEYPGDIATWSQTRADVDVIRLVYSSFHPEMSMLYNHPDEELDALLTSLQTTVDTEERLAIAEQAQRRIVEQGYSVPVLDRVSAYGYSDELGGFLADIEGKPLLNEVWLAP